MAQPHGDYLCFPIYPSSMWYRDYSTLLRRVPGPHNTAVMSDELPNNKPEDDEVNILKRRKPQNLAPTQTIPFTDLPAEIRNRIYELSLPIESDELIVSTPFKDDLMVMGTQPALTRVSHQLRSETLEMFNSRSTFVVYINKFDFNNFTHWAKSITSGPSPPPTITVHVKLLSRITCLFDLRDLVRSWRDLRHETLHLKIHNCYAGPPVLRGRFDQRRLVVKAIEVAEELRAEGEFSEENLSKAFCSGLEGLDRGEFGCRLGFGRCPRHPEDEEEEVVGRVGVRTFTYLW